MEIKLLSCPLCTVSHFQNVIVLRDALINVTKKPLTCPVCDDVLFGLDKFTIHLFTHSNLIVNQNCDKIVSNGSNDNNNNNNENISHAATTTSHNLTIENCVQLQTQLVENVIVDSISTKNAHCEICNFDFTDANMLEMHRTLLHSNGFSCHLCQKKFKMHGSLMVHMRVAHYGFKNKFITTPENEENCKQEIFVTTTATNTDIDSSPPPKAFDNKQWECDVCLKRFTTKYFLKKHKRLHTGEMPYECALCNKSFTFQQSYHKHMLYHSSDKPHTCNECGRAFKELSTLHNHQRIHSGERPFGCETCGKRFRQRVSYLVHKRIHTGAMPYKCTACEKSFRYKVSQRTHKCKAQPPGSVVRQFGDLVQKLLQNRPLEETESEVVTTTEQMPETVTQPSPSIPGTIVSETVTVAVAPVTEIENDKPIDHRIETPCPEVNTDFFGLVLSPTFQITSDQFESLCLTSKENDSNTDEIFNNLRADITSTINSLPTSRQECSTINEECFKQLLYNTPD